MASFWDSSWSNSWSNSWGVISGGAIEVDLLLNAVLAKTHSVAAVINPSLTLATTLQQIVDVAQTAGLDVSLGVVQTLSNGGGLDFAVDLTAGLTQVIGLDTTHNLLVSVPLSAGLTVPLGVEAQLGTDIDLNAALAQINGVAANLNPELNLGLSSLITLGTTLLGDVDLLLAESLGLTNDVAVSGLADVNINLNAQYVLSNSATVNQSPTIALGFSQMLTPTGVMTIDRAITMALSSSISSGVVITLEGDIGLANQLGVASSVISNYITDLPLDAILTQLNEVISTFAVDLVEGPQLGYSANGSKIFDDGIILSCGLVVTSDGTSGTFTVQTPDGRVLHIKADGRVLTIATSDRVLTIAADDRTLRVLN